MKKLLKKGYVFVYVIMIYLFAIIASLVQYVGMVNVADDSSADPYNVYTPKYKEFVGYNDVSYIIGAVIFGVGLILVMTLMYVNRKNIANHAKSGFLGVFWVFMGAMLMLFTLVDMDPKVSDYYHKSIESSMMQDITFYMWPLVTLFLFMIMLTIIRKNVESDIEAEKLYHVSSGRGAYDMYAGVDKEYCGEYHYKVIYK